jgi:hypothetical protein
LDEHGALEAVPFMPEMLAFVGKRFRIASRALKVCSGVGNTHLEGVVFLEQLRCDGSAHGGCEAECRLYWKEAWLRASDNPRVGSVSATNEIGPLAHVAHTNVRQLPVLDEGDEAVYRCQATEAGRAGKRVDWREPTQYLRELTNRNVGPLHLTRVFADILTQYVRRRVLRRGEFSVTPAGVNRVDGAQLDLEPGDWVEVRPLTEIARTLNDKFRHRGLTFTSEMAPYAGKRFRVRRRLSRMIDEETGRMLEMKRDLIALEGVVCTGDHAWGLWLCRRDLYTYWREAWLRRVTPPVAPTLDTPTASAASHESERDAT